MTSATPTLLDPFEVAARPRLSSLTAEAPTEWFDRNALAFSMSDVAMVAMVAMVEEGLESPPWTPEPVDRRWRARGWMDD